MRSAGTASRERESGNILLVVAAPGDMARQSPALTSAFLDDTCALLSHPLLPARVVLALEDPSAPLTPSAARLPAVASGVGTAGQRLSALFAAQFALPGTRAVCAVGIHTPHLPLAFVMEAFSRLASPETDAVFGPADNGGLYLVGAGRFLPELFRDPHAEEGAGIAAISLEHARAAGIRASLLPPWYDMDTPAALTRLRIDLSRKTVMAAGTAAVIGL